MKESELSRYLDNLVEQTSSPRDEVTRLALALGLRQLWRTHLLGRYRGHELSREEAAEQVGIGWVEVSDSHHHVLTDDLAWALELDEPDDEDEDGTVDAEV